MLWFLSMLSITLCSSTVNGLKDYGDVNVTNWYWTNHKSLEMSYISRILQIPIFRFFRLSDHFDFSENSENSDFPDYSDFSGNSDFPDDSDFSDNYRKNRRMGIIGKIGIIEICRILDNGRKCGNKIYRFSAIMVFLWMIIRLWQAHNVMINPNGKMMWDTFYWQFHPITSK